MVIPARNEADRIAATVTAAAGLPGVGLVVVVDDGSGDGTGAAARRAGAVVMRHARNRGKAAAMQTGADAVSLVDQREGREQPRHLLFLDADLAESAAQAGPLTDPVVAGTADMTIAVFAATVKLGGHGLVVGLSGAGIRRAVGWRPVQPLNGQRCLTRAAFEAARPLAPGWGVETALTIDLLRQGLRVTEVEVELAHRATGTGLQRPAAPCAPAHRRRQGARHAAMTRRPERAGPAGSSGPAGPKMSTRASRNRGAHRHRGQRGVHVRRRGGRALGHGTGAAGPVRPGRRHGRSACTRRPTSRSA